MKAKNIYAIFLTLMLTALAYANLVWNPFVWNPSMEGAFIYQNPLGLVAEGWTGWNDGMEILQFSEGNLAHDGSKSQQITWYGGYHMDFGPDGIYQPPILAGWQVGKTYRVLVWFKFCFEASGGDEQGGEITCSIGIDPNGGNDPDVVTNWNSASDITFVGGYEGPWLNVTTCFSPTNQFATIFIKLNGWGHAFDSISEEPHGWDVHCYIDDVNVYHIGDLDFNGSVDFDDFAIFGLAWSSEDGDAQWNPDCDISIPADNKINWLDLKVFTENWLAGQ